MNRQRFLYSLVGLAIGLAGGFVLANAVATDDWAAAARRRNSSAPPAAPAAGTRETAPDSSETPDPLLTLTPDELRRAVARADARPDDRALQLNLGRAIYLYAAHAEQPQLLADALRLLQRAAGGGAAGKADAEALGLAGRVAYDIAQNSGERRFAEARKYFERALEVKPRDADLLNELGRTYYYDRTPDARRAIEAYRRALGVDAGHEAARQNLVNALLEADRRREAEREIEELQKSSPASAALPVLRARLAQKKKQEGATEHK